MTEKENSNYYKIIPEYVMFDEDLLKKPLAILIYGEISALSNKKGYSWASNKYYAERFHKSESTIKRMIAILDSKGYITRKFIYREDGKEVEKRILSIASRPSSIEGVGAQMTPPGVTDDLGGGVTDDLDNNITINNISSADFSYSKFIEWFNELSGKHFKNVESNRKLIRARLNEGYSKEDLAKVVKLKVNQWKDNPEMNRYLRLSTLLSPSHFENYLQEAVDFPVDNKNKLGSATATAAVHKTVDELEAEMNDQATKDNSLIAFVEERPEAIEKNETLRKEYEEAIERRNRAKNISIVTS